MTTLTIIGLQDLINQKNDATILVPCGAHSLDLVDTNSVSGNAMASNSKFFDIVKNLYEFFVRPPFRWNRFEEKGEYMLKRATRTRWSAQYESIRALHSCCLK